MTKKLYEIVGETEYNNLIIDNFPPADVFSVTVKSGEGELQRGSVLALDSTTGKMSHLAAESTSELAANCILAENIDATSGDVVTLAYRTGHFAANQLITKSEYELTFKDKEALRKGGILLSDAIEYTKESE